MYYIQETDKPNPIFRLLNIIRLKGDKIILPITEEQITVKKAKALARKTTKILRKTNCNKLIISKNIKKQEIYLNYLYTENFKIVDGKWLFQLLVDKVLDYLVEKQKLKKEEITVSILVNEMTEAILENIKQIVMQYKRVNIVTNHVEKFKKLEKEILEEYGIMITVGNNKKKSLAKSKIILNVDFPTEIINQYRLYEEAIIINLRGDVKINKKRFNGININDYEIDFEQIEDFDYDKRYLYYKKDIYEGKTSKKCPISYIKKEIKEDRVKISELVGNKTIL